jgi:hypothetical protein
MGPQPISLLSGVCTQVYLISQTCSIIPVAKLRAHTARCKLLIAFEKKVQQSVNQGITRRDQWTKTKGMSNSIVLKQALFRGRELSVIVAVLGRSRFGPPVRRERCVRKRGESREGRTQPLLTVTDDGHFTG